jgi:hypothetical protein
MGIPFDLPEGIPAAKSGVAIPSQVVSDFSGYWEVPTTSIDGSFIVSYKWPFCWRSENKTIHMIAKMAEAGVKWHVAPESEPVIPDARHNEWKVSVNTSGKEWGITLQGENNR